MHAGKKSHIAALIAQGEGPQLDFKFELSDAKKIARSVAAFANTSGGTLLIGVKDNGAVAGVKTGEEIYMAESAATVYCRPAAKFSLKLWNEEGKNILEMMIPESTTKLHKAPDENGAWKVYIRTADSNCLVNALWIRAYERRNSIRGVTLPFTSREKHLLEFLEVHGEITLKQFCDMEKIGRKKAEDVLVNLMALNVLDVKFHETPAKYFLKKLSEEPDTIHPT